VRRLAAWPAAGRPGAGVAGGPVRGAGGPVRSARRLTPAAGAAADPGGRCGG
jgi:hypothetical protein